MELTIIPLTITPKKRGNNMDEERLESILRKAERIVGPKCKDKLLEEGHEEMIKKAKRILESEPDENFKIKPWTPKHITRASDWFAGDKRVQETIAKYYNIKK